VAGSPNPTDQYVGSRVRTRRLMLGLTQMQLADALGVAFQQVQKYENGKNRVSASRLQHISSFLRVPIAFFFEDLPDASNKLAKSDVTSDSNDIFQCLRTAEGLSLAKSFTQIKSPQVRHSIVSLVEGLVDKARR
jgi:transcriptional regulator with XRE-family HTH domain